MLIFQSSKGLEGEGAALTEGMFLAWEILDLFGCFLFLFSGFWVSQGEEEPCCF